ncbi:hypothetical protein CUZ93_1285 [Enterococcus xinjiangensis]|nr:hypothetical protein [Enterococcus lactis]MBL4999098.1 hypothetical protein [Enterococcus lactis]
MFFFWHLFSSFFKPDERKTSFFYGIFFHSSGSFLFLESSLLQGNCRLILCNLSNFHEYSFLLKDTSVTSVKIVTTDWERFFYEYVYLTKR